MKKVAELIRLKAALNRVEKSITLWALTKGLDQAGQPADPQEYEACSILELQDILAEKTSIKESLHPDMTLRMQEHNDRKDDEFKKKAAMMRATLDAEEEDKRDAMAASTGPAEEAQNW